MLDFSYDDISTEEENSVNGEFVASPTVIKIIGCGGGGSSAVNRMISEGVGDVEFIVLNTDLQALSKSVAQTRIPIGQKITGGLGAGGLPTVGEQAAIEDSETLKNTVSGADMIIITAGMGGGTGTGSAPVVAKLAHDAGILTIAVVTTPFDFEGPVRMKYAKDGIEKLRQNVDALIVIPNSQITKIVDKDLSYKDAFRLADSLLCQGVQGISKIITVPGDINLDFNDVKTVLKNSGEAILGVGFAEGEDRSIKAAQSAISNPLLENRTIDGAKNILINISGKKVSMSEVQEIANNIQASADKNVQVFLGIVTDESLGDKISVTVIATGFSDSENLSVTEVQDESSDEVVDSGEWDSILNGGIKVNDSEEQTKSEIETNHLSTVNFSFDKDSLFGESSKADEIKVEESSEEQKTPVLQTVNSFSNEIPDGMKINVNDKSVPAYYRRKLDGLSRSINFSDD